MKAAKFFKKINARVIQMLVMLLILGIFIYVFYYSYDRFSRYQGIKSSEDKRPVERQPMQIPEFFNFSPDEDYENIEGYQLFSFEKKKVERLRSSGGGSGSGSGGYRILGVVKKDKLFLLVRFNSDDKIGLYEQGTDITNGARVEKLTLNQVTISNQSGQEQTHKIFQNQYRPNTNIEMVSPRQRAPVRKNKMDDELLDSTPKKNEEPLDEENSKEKELREEDGQPLDEKRKKGKMNHIKKNGEN